MFGYEPPQPQNPETVVYTEIATPGIEPCRDERLVRATSALDLGGLIEYLMERDLDEIFNIGLCNPHSWRGDYYQLAFSPAKNVSVRTMHNLAQRALGTEFQGYKGDYFMMHEYTDIYLDYYGAASGCQVSKMMLEAMRTWS